MPKFEFTLTRDVTESVNVEIEADTIEEAHLKAVENPPSHGWEVDDNEPDAAYLPDPDDYLEVQPPELQTFRIERLVDAYVVFEQEFEAADEWAALEMARKTDEGWAESHVREFDSTDYAVFDQDDNEVIGV